MFLVLLIFFPTYQVPGAHTRYRRNTAALAVAAYSLKYQQYLYFDLSSRAFSKSRGRLLVIGQYTKTGRGPFSDDMHDTAITTTAGPDYTFYLGFSTNANSNATCCTPGIRVKLYKALRSAGGYGGWLPVPDTLVRMEENKRE